jgi:hypothetical protein
MCTETIATAAKTSMAISRRPGVLISSGSDWIICSIGTGGGGGGVSVAASDFVSLAGSSGVLVKVVPGVSVGDSVNEIVVVRVDELLDRELD